MAPADDGPPTVEKHHGQDRPENGEAVGTVLDRLIREARLSYAEVSRLLGRNPAYIQQFVKRGIPKRLSEEDRRILAARFGVDESVLGGRLSPSSGMLAPDRCDHRMIHIPVANSLKPAGSSLQIDSWLLPHTLSENRESLAAAVVEGDSMAPTLLAGDKVLIERIEGGNPVLGPTSLRDGLYAMANGDHVQMRRLSVNPISGRVAVLADNASYQSIADCDPQAVRLIGRLVWLSRGLP